MAGRPTYRREDRNVQVIQRRRASAEFPTTKTHEQAIAPVGPVVNKIVKVFILGSLAVVGFLLLIYWLQPEKEKLADQYHVSVDKVAMEEKPHGCDFTDAPLGNKHCHFEKEVLPARDCENCPVKAVYVGWKKVDE